MTVVALREPLSQLDCLVIGGGPGGLTAAVYLARFKRSGVVVDADGSRLKMIARTRNVIGFPDGITGGELLERVREHVHRYQVELARTQIRGLIALDGDGFETQGRLGCGTRQARPRSARGGVCCRWRRFMHLGSRNAIGCRCAV